MIKLIKLIAVIVITSYGLSLTMAPIAKSFNGQLAVAKAALKIR